MIFCTYCGKSFTRKEHLERHIPSHTNVKPYHCSMCQLAFPRRDLLQRHHSTYHEARDPAQPLSGAAPKITGPTPIACINCASSKAGCDKGVPCSRCADKNLPCEARFARRSSKTAIRSPSSHNRMQARHLNNGLVNVDHMVPEDIPTESCTTSLDNTTDPHPEASSSQGKTEYLLNAPHFATDTFQAPPTANIGGADGSMCLSGGLIDREALYQDLVVWNEYPMEPEMYPNTGAEMQNNMGLLAFMDSSETSPGPETMASGSINNSLSISHSQTTSIASQVDFERLFKVVQIVMPATGEAMIPEFEVIIEAEAAWPFAQCNRRIFSAVCPRTAIVHLESLEQQSKHEATWNSLDLSITQAEINHGNSITILPLSPNTRDRMLAITQSFLHTALETHRGGVKGGPSASSCPAPGGGFSFLVLPPSRILEYFFQNYVHSLAPYYLLINGGVLDPNELMLNNQASTLLLLLMIANGATSIPSTEARCLTAGLTETCRISLFNIIEKDVELSADPVVLRCALLFTILGVWGGDAWHMNIAMGQRGMYLAMLKHAGMLEPQPAMILSFSDASSIELQWRAWLQRESKNRLVYNWVMVDQELSLFYDTAPILSITELETPTPASEGLWLAKDATRWLAAVQQQSFINTDWLHSPSNSPASPPLTTPSLCDLFQDMFHDNVDRRHGQLSPLQIKLLLHPLQSLLYHLRQVLSCFSDDFGSRRGTRTASKASTLLRLEEVQSLLQKWYDLCAFYAKDDPISPVTRASLVLYNLISLNAVTSFPEIERRARKEAFDGSNWDLSFRFKRCIYQPREALFHCGQVIRLICSMPREGRPHWWSAAIYRATMILWVDSMSRIDPNTQRIEKGQIFAIDAVTPEHPSVASYLWDGDGIPVLTKAGGYTELHRPDNVLSHCIALLDTGVAMRISDGIKRKLQTLYKNWNMESIQDHI